MRLDWVYVYKILDESVWSSWHEGYAGYILQDFLDTGPLRYYWAWFLSLWDAFEDILSYTAKITSFSKCIFRVYLIQGCNQKISLYLVWKSIIWSTKSLLNYPYIYFLKGEIHVLNLNRTSVIRIDSLLILCISKLICRDQNKIYNFHLLTSSRLSAVRDKNNNECFILCNPGLQKE